MTEDEEEVQKGDKEHGSGEYSSENEEDGVLEVKKMENVDAEKKKEEEMKKDEDVEEEEQEDEAVDEKEVVGGGEEHGKDGEEASEEDSDTGTESGNEEDAQTVEGETDDDGEWNESRHSGDGEVSCLNCFVCFWHPQIDIPHPNAHFLQAWKKKYLSNLTSSSPQW